MLKDVAPRPVAGGVKRARALRRAMSLPEVLLWQVLRTRPNGLKFRKQHPTGAYVLDFYCGDARLAIEVDGEAHGRGDRPRHDGRRRLERRSGSCAATHARAGGGETLVARPSFRCVQRDTAIIGPPARPCQHTHLAARLQHG